jgi:hypothetical protein
LPLPCANTERRRGRYQRTFGNLGSFGGGLNLISRSRPMLELLASEE